VSIEVNKSVVCRYYGEIDALRVDVLDDILISDYDNHHPVPLPNLSPRRAGAKAAFGPLTTAFSREARHIVEDQIALGEKVVSRLTCRGGPGGRAVGLPADP
jgi:hypothetical protein